MSSRSVTLTDVARHAGVSLATASRVLNGSSRTVGVELRDRVLSAAADLDYTPNIHAQAVARGASNVLGLIVHDIDDPYFSAIAAGAMRVADEHGLIVSLGSTGRDFERERDYVTLLRAQRARGMIIAGSRSTNRETTHRLAHDVAMFRRVGGRVACVGQNRLATDTVLPENAAGARALARTLLDLGHRRFVVLAGPRHLLTARDRLAGFRKALIDSGLDETAVHTVPGAFTRDGGYESCVKVVDAGLDATCIFAVNDVMAVGAMAALRERGVRVPEDVSVAGFDDIATLRDVVPGLTTVRLPLYDMGAAAARLVVEAVERARPRVVRIRGEVVVRDSTRPVP